MSIIRVKKDDNYSIISNGLINDSNLSWKARGILVYLLSKPNDWKIYIKHLSDQSEKDGKDSTTNGIDELIKNGYIIRKRIHDENGKFAGYEYDVYEKPLINKPLSGKPETDNPSTGKPETEKPFTENPQLLNTDLTNNSCNKILTIQNTDKTKKEKKQIDFEGKNKYLDRVYLKQLEYDKLLSKYGEKKLSGMIEILDCYIENNKIGKGYTDHYKVLNVAWVSGEWDKRNPQSVKPKIPLYKHPGQVDILNDDRKRKGLPPAVNGIDYELEVRHGII